MRRKIDEGVLIGFFVDSDQDGFGIENETALLCEEEVGYASEAGDCNDFNEDISPDAQEICDLQDNDCNGEIDDYTGSDAPAWYLDVDGDGFGDIEQILHYCPDENGNGLRLCCF